MAARRRVFADVAPLRESPDFRRLYVGQLISFLGSQLAIVAVPYQVFRLTHSSFQVGLVSPAQLGPLLVGSLIGGGAGGPGGARPRLTAPRGGPGARAGSPRPRTRSRPSP